MWISEVLKTVDNYWNIIADDIYAYRYYENYSCYLKRIRKLVYTLTALISLVIISLSAANIASPAVWSVMVFLSEAAALVYDKFQINDRLNALKYLLPIMKERVEIMQEDWRKIKRGEYSNDALSSAVAEHARFTTELSNRYLEDVEFPPHKKSSEKASRETLRIAERLC